MNKILICAAAVVFGFPAGEKPSGNGGANLSDGGSSTIPGGAATGDRATE